MVHVVSVEIVEQECEVYDIEVEGDHSFIVGGVVVHNSAVCRARDGRVFPLDSGPRPPAHPNCRSTVTPILKSFRDLGIDAEDAPGMTGGTPDYQSYDEWLKKQPREFVDDVLGKTRADLYLRGGLRLDKFVDHKGQSWTLDELRRREGQAFERAGLAA